MFSCRILFSNHVKLDRQIVLVTCILDSTTNLRQPSTLGGQAGRGCKVKIPARPYLELTRDDEDAI